MAQDSLFKYSQADKSFKCDFFSRIKREGAWDMTRYSIFSEQHEPLRTLIQEKLSKGHFSTKEDFALGAMFGMAIGDSMGAPLEFSPCRYGVITVKDMGQGVQGSFSLRPGQWTDDASMGFCLADSLLSCHGFDPIDSMLRYQAW